MSFGANRKAGSIIRPPTTITAVRLSNKRQKFLQLSQSLCRNSNFVSHFRRFKTPIAFKSLAAYADETTELSTLSHAKHINYFQSHFL